MAAGDDNMLRPFTLPSIGQKQVTAGFDGGRIGSVGGILLLAGAGRRLGLIDSLARNAVQPALGGKLFICLYTLVFLRRGRVSNNLFLSNEQATSAA
jgi:hypothetical protein